jgi:hypothetical protein
MKTTKRKQRSKNSVTENSSLAAPKTKEGGACKCASFVEIKRR